MQPIVTKNHITSIHPLWAVEGGRIAINGINLITEGFKLPEVYLGSEQAQIVHASSQSVSLIVPTGLKRGHTPVKFGGALGETVFVEIGSRVASGLHQVDNPVIDRISVEVSENPTVFFMKGTTQRHTFSIIAGFYTPWQIA